MHFYGLSNRELLDLPIRTFWMLNANVDRLSAQQDLRSLSVNLASQSTSNDSVLRLRDALVLELDEPWKSDPLEAVRDENGFERLRAMALAGH